MGITDLQTASKDVKVGHRGALVISCFFGWPNGESLKAVAEAQRKVCAQYGRVLTLAVIPSSEHQKARNLTAPSTLSPEERDTALKATASISEDLAAQTVASAMVILASGLVGVAVRTFMAGVSLMSRSQVPLRTFRGTEEALKWFESIPGAPGPFPNLAKEIDEWLRT